MRTFVHLFVVCLDIVKHNHENKSEAETQTKVGNTVTKLVKLIL